MKKLLKSMGMGLLMMATMGACCGVFFGLLYVAGLLFGDTGKTCYVILLFFIMCTGMNYARLTEKENKND